MANFDVSVVIPCKNGAPTLGTQLDALLAQKTNTAFEVIVADNGSTDPTPEIVREYASRDPRVRLVDAGRARGANVARNEGITASAGALVLMTDADDIVHPGWIEAYWLAYQRGARAVGGGIDRILADGQLIGRERKLYRSFVGGRPFANATNCGFTREAFETVGGFDESFIGTADEVEFFWRLADAGYRLELVPDAIVSKLQHTSLTDAYNQYFNFGRGEVRLMRKFRGRVSWPTVALALAQAVLWGAGSVVRPSRVSTCSVAWNLGLVTEAFRP